MPIIMSYTYKKLNYIKHKSQFVNKPRNTDLQVVRDLLTI